MLTSAGFFAATALHAQEVPPPAPRSWRASAELSYTDQSGNRSLRLLTGGLKLSHLRRDEFRLDGSVQSRYGESDEAVIARNHHATVAFDLSPTATWSPFLFSEAEHDRFKRLDLRFSGGAGAKYTFYRPPQDAGEGSVSLALLVSHENLSPLPTDTLRESRTTGRWSMRVRGAQELTNTVRVNQVVFYQPVVDHLADYLLRSETSLRVALIERLSLSLAYQHNRTALPPQGVAPDDRIIRTGLVFDF